MKTKKSDARTAGLSEFTRLKKEENRRLLIEAAEQVFKRAGYIAPTVDDIAQEAGVSRQTFYRHFDCKFDIAMSCYERQYNNWLPLWTQIANQNFLDVSVVSNWITTLFKYFEADQSLFHTYLEMGLAEPIFSERSKELIPIIIEQLGHHIPAFAAAGREGRVARKRWVEAWLLIHHLREQCYLNATTGIMSADRQHIIKVFTEAFLRFVEAGTPH